MSNVVFHDSPSPSCPRLVEKRRGEEIYYVRNEEEEKVWRKYLDQSEQSEGFDITDFPVWGHRIFPCDMSKPVVVEQLRDLSEGAIMLYNQIMRHATDFKVVDVVKANYHIYLYNHPVVYYITFHARDMIADESEASSPTTFQARVNIRGPKFQTEVAIIRKKLSVYDGLPPSMSGHLKTIM